jgi:hypothetical protein
MTMGIVFAVALTAIRLPAQLVSQIDTLPVATRHLLDSLSTGHGSQKCYQIHIEEFADRSLTSCSGTDTDTLTYFYHDSATGAPLVSTKHIRMDKEHVRAAADSVRDAFARRYGAGWTCLPTLLPDKTTILWHEWYVPGASLAMHVISYGRGDIRPVLAVQAVVGQRYCFDWIPPPAYIK